MPIAHSDQRDDSSGTAVMPSRAHDLLLGSFRNHQGTTDMAERLVDVLDPRGSKIHTYPINLEDPAATDADFKAKALEAAAHGQLVPDDELGALTAQMHTSRGGQMQPYGDHVGSDSETRSGLEQEVRERAYFLWEQDGCPEGRADEYWSRALEQHLRDRSYVRWQQQGSPDGTADADWLNLKKFGAD